MILRIQHVPAFVPAGNQRLLRLLDSPLNPRKMGRANPTGEDDVTGFGLHGTPGFG